MKKVLTVMILAVMLIMATMTVVNASSSKTLPDELYAIGSQYGMKEADRVKMVKYLTDYPLSDADCDRILALAQEADGIMKANGTTNYHSLPEDVKAKLRALAVEAANIAGVTLDFKFDRIDVYKDGVLYEVLTGESKMPYTGNDFNIGLGASLVAVIALAATGLTIITKKRLVANA